MERHSHKLPCLGMLGVVLSATPIAQANWYVSPELGIGVEYEDNPRLSNIPGTTSSDVSYGAEAQLVLFYNTERTDFKVTPRLRSNWYRDNSDLDSNDQFLTFDFSQAGQKSNFQFRGEYASEATRRAERSDIDFDIDDPDEIPDNDSGGGFENGKRDRLRLSPELSLALTERVDLLFSGEYLDTSYDSSVTQLRGYTEYGMGASLGYKLTEKDTVSLNAGTGKFELEGSQFDSSTHAFGIGYDRDISERTKFTMLVGSETTEDENGVDQNNPIGELSLTHRYALTRVIASYQRAVSSSGFGGLTLRDSIGLTVSRDMTQKLTLSGGIRSYQTSALDSSNVNFVERNYLQVRGRARWNLTREVSLDFDILYTDNERKAPNQITASSDSSRIGLWVNWHPKPLPQ